MGMWSCFSFGFSLLGFIFESQCWKMWVLSWCVTAALFPAGTRFCSVLGEVGLTCLVQLFPFFIKSFCVALVQ